MIDEIKKLFKELKENTDITKEFLDSQRVLLVELIEEYEETNNDTLDDQKIALGIYRGALDDIDSYIKDNF